MFNIVNYSKGLIYGCQVLFCFLGGGIFYKIKAHKKPKGNIVLIPGIMLNSLGFKPMGAYLNKLGYNVYIPRIGWNIWHVDTQAKKVNTHWENQQIDIDKALPLYIVGHSMGGLIAHYWINKYKIKPQKLITLGTPFLGSKSIYWGPWYFLQASRWIHPKSKADDFVIRKAAFAQINVVTDDDSFVEVKSGLPEEIDSEKIVLKKYGGHSALEIRKKAFAKVGELLENNNQP